MNEKLLIINADDYGYDPQVTKGILDAMRRGVVSSTTFMVNTPFSEEAAEYTAGLKVGLHLNFLRWAPVAKEFPAELLVRDELSEARAGELTADIIELEARAQVNQFQHLLRRPPTHLDVHKHLHRRAPVFEGVVRVAQRLRLPLRAIDEPMRAAVRAAGLATTDHFIGDAGAEPFWTRPRLRSEIVALQPGVTELMCHPGWLPHYVKTGYGKQREVELGTFLSKEARIFLSEAKVQVIDFGALPAVTSPSA